MSFQPSPNSTFDIDGLRHRVAEHPAAPGVAYGQEGRAGIVFQLIGLDGDARALKVFKPRFQTPALVGLAEKLQAFAEAPGLQVCRRLVLTARRHRELLRQYPELNYAVLMPWVAGPTWMQVIGERRILTPAQSLTLAQGLLETLTAMEERGLAHCDLSGPNTLLPALLDGGAAEPHGVALVDVEQFYGPGLEKPDILPAGSAGYAHRTAPQGLWSARADRFAGAILLAEMLGWCEASVRRAAAGESYFEPTEIHQDSARYRTLVTTLRRRWGAPVSALLEHAWESETLADCPNFGQWLTALPEAPPADDEPVEDTVATDTASDGALAAVRALMVLARQFETEGNLSSALSTYKQAHAQAPAGGVRDELVLIVQRLEQATALPPPADELAALFDDGQTAYQRGNWAKARELLGGVTHRQPDYARTGQRAASLLAEAEKRLANGRRRGLPTWGWMLGGLALLATITGMLVIFGNGVTATSRASLSVTQTAVFVSSYATQTDQARQLTVTQPEQPTATKPTATPEPPRATETPIPSIDPTTKQILFDTTHREWGVRFGSDDRNIVATLGYRIDMLILPSFVNVDVVSSYANPNETVSFSFSTSDDYPILAFWLLEGPYNVDVSVKSGENTLSAYLWSPDNPHVHPALFENISGSWHGNFTTGELDWAGGNYKIQIAGLENVPIRFEVLKQYSMLWLHNPFNPFLPQEQSDLLKYVDAGGTVLIVARGDEPNPPFQFLVTAPSNTYDYTNGEVSLHTYGLGRIAWYKPGTSNPNLYKDTGDGSAILTRDEIRRILDWLENGSW